MAIQQKIWIHGGLERTGTTSLQRDQFQRLEGVNFLHKPVSVYHLINGGQPWMLAEVDAEIGPRLDDRPTLLSHEGLFGGYTIQLELLRDAFPEASLIFTLRNQYERIFSVYKRSAQSGALTAQLPFRSHMKLFKRSLIMNNCYFSMIREARRLFDNRVHVFCMENYRGRYEALGTEIADLLGGTLAPAEVEAPPRNLSLRTAHRTPMRQYCLLARKAKLSKKLYPLTLRADAALARLLRVNTETEIRAARNIFEPYFSPGNKRLEELLGIQLPPEYHASDVG